MKLEKYIEARIWNNLKRNYLNDSSKPTRLTIRKIMDNIRSIYHPKLDDPTLRSMILKTRIKMNRRWEKAKTRVYKWSYISGLPFDVLFRFYLEGSITSKKDVVQLTEHFIALSNSAGFPVYKFLTANKEKESSRKKRAKLIDERYKELKRAKASE